MVPPGAIALSSATRRAWTLGASWAAAGATSSNASRKRRCFMALPYSSIPCYSPVLADGYSLSPPRAPSGACGEVGVAGPRPSEGRRGKVRVTGGIFGGRVLVSPRDMSVRPTSDRTRQAIFNILRHKDFGIGFALEGATVLDLFAGTGAL